MAYLDDLLGKYKLTEEYKTALSFLSDDVVKVKIHGIELGNRDHENPDRGQPNPIEIRWTQEMEVVVHKTVGHKPLTQCTIPDGLWKCEIKFNTLAKDPDSAEISEVLEKVRDLKAGPGLVIDSLMNSIGGKCMYLVRKTITQRAGTKDWYHTVELEFLEANDGS